MKTGHTSSGNLLADRRYEYAQDMLARDECEAAADILRQTVDLVPGWAPLWFSLGETLLRLKDKTGAVRAFSKVIEIDPHDCLGARGHLALLGSIGLNRDDHDANAKEALSAGYVTALFNQYADRFDHHLTLALDYRGPEILLQALLKTCDKEDRAPQFQSCADLGCGTGLMANAIRPHVRALAGVDLSSEMMVLAEKSGLYNTLQCDGILPFLTRCEDRQFDLLTAADVLVYLGDLQPLMQQAARTLVKGGLFALTIQACEGESFQLGKDMRYHHSAHYLHDVTAKAGLEVHLLEPCITRKDSGLPVHGYVAVLGLANRKNDAGRRNGD